MTERAEQPQVVERTTRSETITFWQGVAIIFGANIGAGILSLPYGARNGGFPALALALAVTGVLTTASMLYVAEVALRTREPLQLAGLARKYLGNTGSWLVFAGVMINGFGALIAYSTGSGNILSDMLSVPPTVGSLIFFVPGVVVVWYGLRATGRSEQVITAAMLGLILLLCGWTFIGPGVDAQNLTNMNPYFIIPIVNLAVFAFIAQYTVPELARGLARNSNPRVLPRAIVVGMVMTGFLLALVPLAALGMMGPDGITPVVTIAWGNELGSIAYYCANLFAILAMLTSFWAIALTLMTNIFDRFSWSDKSPRYRLAAISIATVIPFAIGLLGLAGFVSALGYAGGFAGAIMSIVPVLMLRKARKSGDVEPVWSAGRISHPLIQALLVSVFTLAFVYSLLALTGLVPEGWS